MLNDLKEIDEGMLLEEVSHLKKSGYRLSGITCEKEGNSFEFIYHFDLNCRMKNIKMFVENDGNPVVSISGIYPSAFLIENEYQDLFGLTFDGLIIDYRGNLYLAPDGPKAPMADGPKEVHP